jgi:hypothetical protein
MCVANVLSHMAANRPSVSDKLKRTKKLSAPASESELAAYSEACRKVKMEPADTLRKLVDAFVEQVERESEIIVPIRLAGRKGK